MHELDEFLEHEGVKRKSGRFKWGSGEVPYQHEPWFKKGVVPSDKTGFYNRYRALKSAGYSDIDIAKSINEELYNGEKDYRGNDKFNTRKLRQWVTIGKEQQNAENITKAIYYRHERQMSLQAIADKFDTNESTIRSWLEPGRIERMNKTRAVADMIKEAVDKKGYLDVGKSLEIQLSLAQKDSEKMISRTSTEAALEWLCSEGYKISNIKTEQAQSPGNYTEMKVLTKEDIPYKDIVTNKDKIRPFTEYYSNDGEHFYKTPEKPRSVDSKRIEIIYAEDGGTKKDGVIELRPGVKDISLGNDQYAQVRIAVDDTHYLKGMAIYNNNLPEGVDIRFNTNKTKDIPLKGPTSDTSVLKPFKLNEDGTDFKDPDNPFGSRTKQNEPYIDINGNTVNSCVNKVNTNEDWAKWAKNLPSQFESKQPKSQAKRQLAIEFNRREQEYENISKLVNPTLKKKLLMDLADELASDANHLKAAPLPGQATHVILPVTSLKDNEIYAPNYNQGEEVVLVRFPHAGPFESPRLRVNNRNKEARENLGRAEHAVGINSNVAEQLSGADFDGDTVLVIPVRGQKIKTEKPLAGLENFDDKVQYKAYKGMPRVGKEDSFDTQMQMGKVSNLITDMTIAGAPPSDIVKAVKHSMVVIDAEKHNLDWKRSEKENNIAGLKEKYQGKKNGGASTLISQANADQRIHKRKEITDTNIMTPEELKDFKKGYKIYRETGEKYLKPTFTYIDPETGKKKTTSNVSLMTPEQKAEYYAFRKEQTKANKEYMRTGKEYELPTSKLGIKYTEEWNLEKVPRMSVHRDARELISDHNAIIENIYAEHANRLKALELKARAEARTTPSIQKDPLAAKKYSTEVDSLKRKLFIAESYSPLERQAQNLTEAQLKAWKAQTPDATKEEIKKKKFKLLAQNRDAVGGDKKQKFTLTEKEWEAIQAKAITNAMMIKILNKADQDQIRQLATPKNTRGINKAQLARAKAMVRAGYSQAEVAKQLGISASTLNKYIAEM